MWLWKRKPVEVKQEHVKPGICPDCLERARASRVWSVYVYDNGHIMNSDARIPSLLDWPDKQHLRTFCGRRVYGMGLSTMYVMPA